MNEDRDVIDALRRANELLRSAYQIAQRSGMQTNWGAFEEKLREELARQFLLLGSNETLTE